MSERLIVAINSASASNPRGASLKSSILNLSNTILGTGLLALPAAFKHAGIVLGLFMVFSSSFLAGVSLFLLSEAAGLSGSKSTATFYSVCEAALPRLSLLVDGIVILSTFAGAATYLMVATDSFVNMAGNDVRWPWTIMSVAIVSPFCFFRSFNALKYTSGCAVVILIAISVLVVLFAAGTDVPILQPCSPNSSDCHGRMRPFTSVLPSLRALAVLVNAFICQQNLFSVTRELEQPTRIRTLIVICASLLLALVLYVTVGVAGYATFGDSAHLVGDLLNAYPQTNALVGAARFGLALVVLASFPLQAFAFRTSLLTFSTVICELLKLHPAAPPVPAPAQPRDVNAGTESTPPSAASGQSCASGWASRHLALEPRQVMSQLFLLLGTGSLALAVSDLGKALELGGALMGNILTFVAPGLLYTLLARKSQPESAPKSLQIAAAMMLVLGVVLVPCTVAASLAPRGP